MWSQLCKLQNSVSFHPFKIEEHYGHKQSETAAKEPNTRSAKRSEVYDSGLGAKTSKAEADGCGWGTLLAGGGTGAGTEGWSRFGACHKRRVFARVESQYFSSLTSTTTAYIYFCKVESSDFISCIHAELPVTWQMSAFLWLMLQCDCGFSTFTSALTLRHTGPNLVCAWLLVLMTILTIISFLMQKNVNTASSD